MYIFFMIHVYNLYILYEGRIREYVVLEGGYWRCGAGKRHRRRGGAQVTQLL